MIGGNYEYKLKKITLELTSVSVVTWRVYAILVVACCSLLLVVFSLTGLYLA